MAVFNDESLSFYSMYNYVTQCTILRPIAFNIFFQGPDQACYEATGGFFGSHSSEIAAHTVNLA